MKTLLISPHRSGQAFTLLEVMVAVGIFFMAIFSILSLTSQTLRIARNLEPIQADASSIAAELSLTNRLMEGPIPSELITHFNEMYPGYSCDGSIIEVDTNGFFQVNLEVIGPDKKISSELQLLLWRPLSASGAGGVARR